MDAVLKWLFIENPLAHWLLVTLFPNALRYRADGIKIAPESGNAYIIIWFVVFGGLGYMLFRVLMYAYALISVVLESPSEATTTSTGTVTGGCSDVDSGPASSAHNTSPKVVVEKSDGNLVILRKLACLGFAGYCSLNAYEYYKQWQVAKVADDIANGLTSLVGIQSKMDLGIDPRNLFMFWSAGAIIGLWFAMKK